MAEAEQRTRQTIKVRQVTDYQASWTEIERGTSGAEEGDLDSLSTRTGQNAGSSVGGVSLNFPNTSLKGAGTFPPVRSASDLVLLCGVSLPWGLSPSSPCSAIDTARFLRYLYCTPLVNGSFRYLSIT
jgi:hypothetical protein